MSESLTPEERAPAAQDEQNSSTSPQLNGTEPDIEVPTTEESTTSQVSGQPNEGEAAASPRDDSAAALAEDVGPEAESQAAASPADPLSPSPTAAAEPSGSNSPDVPPAPASSRLAGARWESRWNTGSRSASASRETAAAAQQSASPATPFGAAASRTNSSGGKEKERTPPPVESKSRETSGGAVIRRRSESQGQSTGLTPVDIPGLLRIPERQQAEPVPFHPDAQDESDPFAGLEQIQHPQELFSETETSESETPLIFQFRDKSLSAPTPEEAADEMEWLAGSQRNAHIGKRSELGRSGGRGRADASLRTGEARHPADEASQELDSEEGSGAAPAQSLEDADGRDDRGGRRRKDKRGRRRDRNGSAEEAVDIDSPDVPDGYEKLIVRSMDPEMTAEAEELSRISLDQRLGKEIFVNTGSRETRVAYLVAGQLTELHIEREERLVGAVCKARVERVLPGLDAAFVDIGLEKNGFLMAGDVVPDDDEDDGGRGRRPKYAGIAELLKPKQEILVQVNKAPGATKGARVSTKVSLPGRYLVLMPETESLGVSRKIDDDGERDRLKKIGRTIRPSGFGVIIRTEAENKTEEELRNDVDFLVRLWQQIQEKYRIAKPGTIVQRDLSLTFKICRDLFGSDVNRFVIDNREEYEKVLELVDFISPRLRSRVILYDEPEPIFQQLGIEDEIERLFRSKVWLKSGGWLAIDEVESLTAIDVNSGKNVGSNNPAQTHFKINMEAVGEICRQLRLRDIGGMIILDFIDMANPRDRAAVMKALDMNLKRDRSRTKIAHLSPLGLVEMTRKRTGETFSEVTTEPCSYCTGRGRTLSAETVSILVEREITARSRTVDDEAFLVMVHPSVAPYLIGPEGCNVEQLEHGLRRAVYVRSTDNLHIEKFEVVPADLQELERQLLPFREGQVVDCVVEQSPAINLPHAVSKLDGYLLDIVNGGQYLGRRVRARLLKVGRSTATAEVIGGGRHVDRLGGA